MSWNYRIVNKNSIIALFILIAFYIIGCTTYSIPNGSKVVIKKEDLNSYNPKNFPKNKIEKIKLKNEDQLIIQAIFLEEQRAYRQSNKFYALLYELTKKEEYLLKELTTAYMAGIISKNLNDLEKYIEKHPNNLQAQRILLSFYLREKKLNSAKKIGKILTQHSKQAVDFELAANPYIFSGEYEASLKYLKEAYRKTFNEDILLKIVTIQINYLHKVEEAIAILEEHKKRKGCSEKICLQLISIYAQQHKVSKLISIYKQLYKSTKKEVYAEKVIEGYLLNQNFSDAIAYLEKKGTNHSLLYSLYMEQKEYKKANSLAKRLQKETQNPKWYAEYAISLYEQITHKKDKVLLEKVIKNFEKALELGMQNPIYLNYYGYTLINNELDIQKGLKIVQKALNQEPENTYFLDSLAWGYYKLGNCKKAYPTMKKVVEVEGLNEEEIIEHWNAIHKKCNKD